MKPTIGTTKVIYVEKASPLPYIEEGPWVEEEGLGPSSTWTQCLETRYGSPVSTFHTAFLTPPPPIVKEENFK